MSIGPELSARTQVSLASKAGRSRRYRGRGVPLIASGDNKGGTAGDSRPFRGGFFVGRNACDLSFDGHTRRPPDPDRSES